MQKSPKLPSLDDLSPASSAHEPVPSGKARAGWHEEAGTAPRSHVDPNLRTSLDASGEQEADALLGRRLNDTYLVESVIGEGGMGKVYRASHTRIPQKQFALKVLRRDLSQDTDQLARFQREAETAACISHPNVIGVYDVGRTTDGYSYLVCELLEGHDLDSHLEKNGPLAVAAAVRIAVQVCSALEAAHAGNVVHRDLKPQNVFLLAEADGKVSEFPRVKVLDFGLSRFMDTADTQLTRTGVVMGTPSFMAPEQANGLRVDHRVDIYGIGVLLYTMLTGKPPFSEDTLNATLLAVLTREPIRPRSLNPDIPEDLELVVQRAMAKSADDRFADVEEIRKALEAFEPTTTGAPASTRKERRPAVPRKGSRARLSADAYEVSTCRSRLLVYLALAALGTLVACMSAVSGLELFTGPLQFTRTELGLLFMGVAGTLLMPAALTVRRFRRKVWTSSAKVLDLLEAVRGPVVAALLSVGIATLAVRFADVVVARFAFEHLLGPDPGLGWAGWTWLLPAVAALAAATSDIRRRLGRRDISHLGRLLIGAPLIGVCAALCGAVLFLGLEWRSTSMVRATPQATVQAGSPSPAGTHPTSLKSDEVAAPTAPEVLKTASEAELTKATAQGIEGLLPLSEKYPKDPKVLEPLMMAFAARATSIADAMAVAKRLFEVAPQKAGEESAGVLVKRGAQTPGNASKLAFELMAEHMGSRGPDFLYELWLSHPKLREETTKLLSSPQVTERATPALRVAFELRQAKTCEDRLPLLERARLLGDDRSVAILSPLTVGSKRGCGKWKNRPCPAPCADQAKEYLDAIRGITQRHAATTR